MNPTPLRPVPQEAHEDIVSILRLALQRAERGETVGLAIVEQHRGEGGFVSHKLHSGAHAALMIGELELLKFQILTRQWGDD